MQQDGWLKVSLLLYVFTSCFLFFALLFLSEKKTVWKGREVLPGVGLTLLSLKFQRTSKYIVFLEVYPEPLGRVVTPNWTDIYWLQYPECWRYEIDLVGCVARTHSFASDCY